MYALPANSTASADNTTPDVRRVLVAERDYVRAWPMCDIALTQRLSAARRALDHTNSIHISLEHDYAYDRDCFKLQTWLWERICLCRARHRTIVGSLTQSNVGELASVAVA